MTPDGDEGFPGLADRYRIEHEAGRGGMATVYVAEDLRHHRRVAIKVLEPGTVTALGRERFLREIEIAARLNHPHIVPLFEAGALGERCFYVMPYVEGETLRARLVREGQLPIEEALRLASEVASALGHAHKHGILHRDVKPENVLLSDGMARLSDFGISRAYEPSDPSATSRGMTEPGTVIGTPRYMSPEQAAGGALDPRTDLYALACVLYEMLAGHPPFVAPTPDAVIQQHLTVAPRPLHELRASIPAALSAVVARALAKLPADRFDSASSFVEALTAARNGSNAIALEGGATGRSAIGNLPNERTPFIGREAELADCERWLAETRLLTVTGIGGGGKTRLALELAARVRDRVADGAWFVDLGPLQNEEQVVPAVASVFGVGEVPGTPLLATLGRRLEPSDALLVLDNCEHLIGATATAADRLLAGCPRLTIVATSREGLGVSGERVYPLQSLSLPPVDGDFAAACNSDAVRLFEDRARAVNAAFTLTPESLPVVAEICRRLDGIPLAIKLAAARVRVLSVEQIRDRLDDRFRLLTGGNRTALPRHQTLQAAIQWSYGMLPPEEQRLLQALSVFAGGFTLGSATRVTADDAGVLDEFAVMDTLTRLVDKSLVVVTPLTSGDPRYGLLETIRQFARERWIEAGDLLPVRERHLDEYLALAESAYVDRFAREETLGATLETELDNLRVALDYARATDSTRYLELAGALAWFWQVRSRFHEGLDHLTQALSMSPADVSPASSMKQGAHARALWGAANIRSWRGETDVALAWMEEAIALWRKIGDRREEGLALIGIGWTRLLAGQEERGRATFEESLSVLREVGDPVPIHHAMAALCQSLVALSRVAEARPLAHEVIAVGQADRDRRIEHFGWHFLADCALIEGRCEESLGLYRKSLELARALADRIEIGFEVEGVAMSLAGLGDRESAVRLSAAVRAEWRRLGVDLRIRFWDGLLERYIEPARRALPAETAERCRREGEAMSFEEAIAAAGGAAEGS
ncbi:MAG: protein kinase domain-containing protein [Candidatus Eiseniibacteriota bacterium]